MTKQYVIFDPPIPGYKARAEVRRPQDGEWYFGGWGNPQRKEPSKFLYESLPVLERNFRKYDWSKTHAHAWVYSMGEFFTFGQYATENDRDPGGIYKCWIPHVPGSLCPFDEDSVYVDVRELDNGMVFTYRKLLWSDIGKDRQIIAVRFDSLQEGVEW